MERNGFFSRLNQQRSLQGTTANSRARSIQSREQTTLKSTKPIANAGNSRANKMLNCSRGVTRHSWDGARKVPVLNSTVSARRQPFNPAAGLSTVDQSLMQSRDPWIGNAFVNKRSKQTNYGFNITNSILHKKTLSQPDIGYGTIWSSEKSSEITRNASTIFGSQAAPEDLNSALSLRHSIKKKVYLLSDPSLARMREASSIYVDKNTAFHKQRLKHIEKTIEDKHRAQVKRQMSEAEMKSKEKYKKNVFNLNELKKVRKKFFSEKRKRVNSTYVSVAALETPEVDRYAYGLPEEGKEHTFVKKSFLKRKTNYREKWDESIQKAKSIVKVLDLREKVQRNKTLPILKPLTSQTTRKKGSEIFQCNEVEVENIEEEEVKVTEEERKTDHDQQESNAVFNKVLFDITSEVSSLHETSTDMDTDFEDL